MGRGDNLGEFEAVVLLAVARLGPDAYGMTIRREIHEATGRDVSVPAVYGTLDRLVGKGYLEASMGEATGERGGRARKYFRLLPAGAETLLEFRSMMDSLWRGVDLAPFRS